MNLHINEFQNIEFKKLEISSRRIEENITKLRTLDMLNGIDEAKGRYWEITQ